MKRGWLRGLAMNTEAETHTRNIRVQPLFTPRMASHVSRTTPVGPKDPVAYDMPRRVPNQNPNQRFTTRGTLPSPAFPTYIPTRSRVTARTVPRIPVSGVHTSAGRLLAPVDWLGSDSLSRPRFATAAGEHSLVGHLRTLFDRSTYAGRRSGRRGEPYRLL